MKNNKMNHFLMAGLLVISITQILGHLISLPEIIQGFGMGLGLSLELFGVFANKHDLTKFKEFKRNIVKPIRKYLY